jgi:hypothetical protein
MTGLLQRSWSILLVGYINYKRYSCGQLNFPLTVAYAFESVRRRKEAFRLMA